MNKHTKILFAFAALTLSASAVAACSDSGATTNGSSGNPLNPTPGTDSGTPKGDSGTAPGADAGTGCPNKPVGCFCGTPTTQQQFLNRCTNATALKVTLTPKAASTNDIP